MKKVSVLPDYTVFDPDPVYTCSDTRSNNASYQINNHRFIFMSDLWLTHIQQQPPVLLRSEPHISRFILQHCRRDSVYCKNDNRYKWLNGSQNVETNGKFRIVTSVTGTSGGSRISQTEAGHQPHRWRRQPIIW